MVSKTWSYWFVCKPPHNCIIIELYMYQLRIIIRKHTDGVINTIIYISIIELYIRLNDYGIILLVNN